jgi:hypothetical protein
MKKNISIFGISVGLCVAVVLNGMDAPGVPKVPEETKKNKEVMSENDQHARVSLVAKLFVLHFGETVTDDWLTSCDEILQPVREKGVKQFLSDEEYLKIMQNCIYPMDKAFLDVRLISKAGAMIETVSEGSGINVDRYLATIREQHEADKSMLEAFKKNSDSLEK